MPASTGAAPRNQGHLGGRPRGGDAGVARTPRQGSASILQGRARAGRAWKGAGVGAGPVPMLLSLPRSPFWLPGGTAWCMMQHRPSRTWAPRSPRRCPPRALLLGPRAPGGPSGQALVASVGGWLERHPEPAGSEGDLPLHGATQSTPPRHEVRGKCHQPWCGSRLASGRVVSQQLTCLA